MYNDEELYEEPYPIQFISQGLSCEIRMNYYGCLCGYVGVQDSHPLYLKQYDEPCEILTYRMNQILNEMSAGDLEVPLISMIFSKRDDDGNIISTPSNSLMVHGGLTYSGFLGEDKGIWFFGFDCGHCTDQIPYFCDGLSEGALKSTNELMKSFEDIFKALGDKESPVETCEKIMGRERNNPYRDIDYAREQVELLAEQLALIG